MTWNDSIVFDILDQTTGEQETTITVSFETTDDSLNQEMEDYGAFEAWKGVYLQFEKSQKLTHSNLLIANGLYGNEVSKGFYEYNPKEKTIHLLTFNENGTMTMLDVIYNIEINGDQIHLTHPDSPGYNAIYRLSP